MMTLVPDSTMCNIPSVHHSTMRLSLSQKDVAETNTIMKCISFILYTAEHFHLNYFQVVNPKIVCCIPINDSDHLFLLNR